MMSHLDEGTIHAWIDGALADERARSVEHHVRECSRCAEAVAEARGLVAASSRILRALDEVPANVIPAPGVRRRRPLWRAAPWVSGIAAALLAAVLLRAPEGARERGVAIAPTVAAPETVSSEVATPTPVDTTALAVTPSAPTRVAQTPAVREDRTRSTIALGEITISGANTRRQVTDERARQDARAEVGREEAARVAAAPAPPPASGMAPQASALLGMRALRPMDPLRDTVATHIRLAGCYLVPVATHGAGVVSQFSAQARQKSAARGAVAAAAPARENRAPNRLLVRLDTLAGRTGYMVRLARSDSSVGWWRTIAADSAQLDLLGAGVVTVSSAQRVECPTSPE